MATDGLKFNDLWSTPTNFGGGGDPTRSGGAPGTSTEFVNSATTSPSVQPAGYSWNQGTSALRPPQDGNIASGYDQNSGNVRGTYTYNNVRNRVLST